MAAENPFVYGEIVPRAAFIDRDVELDRLVEDLADGQKVFLISPRRYGKSSLVRQALDILSRRRIATVDVTVSSFSSYVAFLEGYARALVALETRTGRATTWLRDLFRGVTPEVRLEAGAHAGVALSFPSVRTARDVARLSEEVFTLPAVWPPASTGASSSRLTSSRRLPPSMAEASSRRSAPRFSSSVRLAMSSPDPSPA